MINSTIFQPLVIQFTNDQTENVLLQIILILGVLAACAILAVVLLIIRYEQIEKRKAYENEQIEKLKKELKQDLSIEELRAHIIPYKKKTSELKRIENDGITFLEDELEVATDHEYDGIRELDNNLPPWWKNGFYLTIVTAFIYMIYYHVGSDGRVMENEYAQELAQAQVLKDAYLAKAKNLVDENNVTLLTDETDLAKGAKTYSEKCISCHGKNLEGGQGPNLTDEYWIHDGSIKKVFMTIKYGVPEKGMLSWKSMLKPGEMQELASYILSKQGSNPANAKAPQGELYTPEKDEEM